MNPGENIYTEAQEIAETNARRHELMFERMERWIVGEFCRVMQTRASGKRTRALRELSLRARQLLRSRGTKPGLESMKGETE